MAKKTDNRTLVTFTCSECGAKNYRESKNSKNTPEKLELNKFCPNCRKTTKHKETKEK